MSLRLLPLRTKHFEVKVLEINHNELCAKAVDPNEIDDVVHYHIFLPAYFGGQTAPYPKVGQTLFIAYDKRNNNVVEAWLPRQMAAA